MIRLTLQQIQADFIHHLQEAARKHEAIVVCEDDRPIAEIRPLASPGQTPRPLGLGAGLGQILPSFYEPLPDDVVDAFAGKHS
jgi:antitoxin (DNA-binding transcriptional repressor) of toxin-antitoxin stability system